MAENRAENEIKTANPGTKTGTKKKKKKRISKKVRVFLILLAVLLVLAGGVALFLLLTRGSVTMEGAVKNYFSAVEDRDVQKYIKVCYPAAWSDHYVAKGTEVDLENLVSNVFERQSDTHVSDISMHHVEELEDMFVRRISDKIKELYDVDLSISAVYRVYFQMNVSYEDNGQEVTYESDIKTRYVYKYKGKWYYLADTLLLMDMDLDQ